MNIPPVVQFTHNVEQRAKYADEPQRFLESEIDLDEAVKSMTVRLQMYISFHISSLK